MDLDQLPAAAALAGALLAGVVSFLSPCVAPLVPGYLAFVTGSELPAKPRARPLLVRRTIAFVAGFALVFTLLGLGAATATRALVEHRQPLELVGGAMVAAMGLAMVWGTSMLPGTGSILVRLREPGSYLGATGVGAVFAIAWSPCIGPALAAILAIASTGQDPLWGAALLLTYSLGLGIPFVVAALGLQRFLRVSRAVREHTRTIQLVAGLAMVGMGVLIATGAMGKLTAHLARLLPALL